MQFLALACWAAFGAVLPTGPPCLWQAITNSFPEFLALTLGVCNSTTGVYRGLVEANSGGPLAHHCRMLLASWDADTTLVHGLREALFSPGQRKSDDLGLPSVQFGLDCARLFRRCDRALEMAEAAIATPLHCCGGRIVKGMTRPPSVDTRGWKLAALLFCPATYRECDFTGIRVMARSLSRSSEPGSITDVAASIGHVAGDQP